MDGFAFPCYKNFGTWQATAPLDFLFSCFLLEKYSIEPQFLQMIHSFEILGSVEYPRTYLTPAINGALTRVSGEGRTDLMALLEVGPAAN